MRGSWLAVMALGAVACGGRESGVGAVDGSTANPGQGVFCAFIAGVVDSCNADASAGPVEHCGPGEQCLLWRMFPVFYADGGAGVLDSPPRYLCCGDASEDSCDMREVDPAFSSCQ
jgi:hypothetical protein